ncbi:MAG: hypothetical protein RMA76_16190 [Deltaproteobacteria bacterium]
MTVRITPLKVVFLLAPLLLLVFGLEHYDAYWVPRGPKNVIAGEALLFTTGFCYFTLLLSYVPFVHDFLSQGFWYKFHFVRSSPGQASVALFVVRWGAQLLLWTVAILAATGRG